MKKLLTLLAISVCTLGLTHGQTKKVLFLGNSYTEVNNLPQMLFNVVASTGETLYYESNTPGGYTLEGHFSNQTSINKVKTGIWDFVVLQEQSQLPSFPLSEVQSSVFPFAHLLDSTIIAHNSCTETVFYMTWGRKNGDASNCPTWPPVCTYAGMDSLLNLRYRMMADSNNAILSPVGAVWRFLRQNHPSIELYQTDESHPSVAGTYAAACSFYSVLFRKDPLLVTYNPTLSGLDASFIRNAVKQVVFDSLIKWNIGKFDPRSSFTYSRSGNLLTFINSSLNVESYIWYFGDGDSSTLENPTHLFPVSGTFDVKLVSLKCGKSDTSIQTVNLSTTGVDEMKMDVRIWTIYPNPAQSTLTIDINTFEPISYKIFDVRANEICAGIVDNLDNNIDISTLAKGIYFIRLFQNNGPIGTRKFVKSDN